MVYNRVQVVVVINNILGTLGVITAVAIAQVIVLGLMKMGINF
jgi:hypothetical protein